MGAALPFPRPPPPTPHRRSLEENDIGADLLASIAEAVTANRDGQERATGASPQTADGPVARALSAEVIINQQPTAPAAVPSAADGAAAQPSVVDKDVLLPAPLRRADSYHAAMDEVNAEPSLFDTAQQPQTQKRGKPPTSQSRGSTDATGCCCQPVHTNDSSCVPGLCDCVISRIR